VKRAAAILATLTLWIAVAPAAARQADDTPRIDLPLTIEKVWFRSGGKRREGDLTVTRDGLEFTARKKAFSIPLDRVHVISFGKMRGDVDTDWVVLAVGVTPPHDLVGFRDGKKWGYGGRTSEIFNQLRRVFEQLSAAQYRVPPGRKPYEDPDRTCAIAIPENWSSYLESLVLIGGRAARGTTIVSAEPIRSVETSEDGVRKAVDDLELLDAILAGESPGFFIERRDLNRGMSCDGFSRNARERVLERAQSDIVFGAEYEVLEPLTLSERAVGGCAGVHVLGRTRRPDGVEVVLELYAVAQGETFYVFGLRALADRFDEFREPLASSVATVKFGVALPE